MKDLNSADYWDMTYRRYFREGSLKGIYLERLLAWHTLLPLIPDRGSFLDVGCGTGGFLGFLKSHRPGLALMGVDFAQSAIEMARLALPDAEFHQSSADELPLSDGQVDVVYSGHLVEHLALPIPALIEQSRVLRRGGRVVVHFPYDDAPYVEHVHDHLTYATVGDWMEEAGFQFEGQLPPVIGSPAKEEGIIFGSKP